MMTALPLTQRVLTWRLPLGGILAAVSLLGAGLFLIMYLKEPGLYRGLLGLTYLALLALMAAYDIRTLRVPNRIVYPSLGFALAASLTLGRGDLIEALLGGAITFLALLVIAVIGRGAMGFADVKVGLLCGIAVGLHGVMPLFLVAFASGGLFAAVLLVMRMRTRKDVVAFTPFLVAATAFSMLYFHLYLLS